MKKRFARIILGVLGAVLLLLGGVWLGESSSSRRYAAELNEYRRAVDGLDQNGVRVDRMMEFYKSNEPYRESKFKSDAEFCAYCRENYPQAVYPSNEWTAEEVLQSYRDTPEIWGRYVDNYNSQGFYFAWTPDYQHCFIIDLDNAYMAYDEAEYKELTSGWLCVDGVRVLAYGQTTVESVDPCTLIAAYQSGDWDGNEVWSTDLSTSVKVDSWDGVLEYQYRAWRYDETTDPDHLAYTDFDWQPWWRKADAPKDAVAAINSHYIENDPWQGDKTSAWQYVDCKLYVDLPVGDNASDFSFTTQVKGLGTFGMSSDGVQLFSRGKLKHSWDLQLDPEKAKLATRFQDPTPAYAHDLAYLYDGERLLALRDDDSVAVMMDRFISAKPRDLEFWGIQGDLLMYWSLSGHYLSYNLPIAIAEDILEVDFSTLRLFTKTDGCYMITRRNANSGSFDDYHAEYLGPESMAYYTDLYENLRWIATTYDW